MSESITDRHSDEEYLEAVRQHEPAATSEIAETVGVTRQSADYRLRQLEDDGRVVSETIGNSLAWRLGEDETEVRSVNPDDAFWDADAYDGEAMSATAVDDVVYGEGE